MTSKEALRITQDTVDSAANIAERDTDATGAREFILAAAYRTPRGRESFRVIGRGPTWEAAVSDARARKAKP